MLATFMEILDTTVVNVSIPHIAGNLASTNEEGTWVVTSYLVSNAIILPISGWLANYLGRKRLLLMCDAGFTLTSLCCGLATSLLQLIVFRVLQGLTGGGLQPLAQAILLETFPKERHGHAMAAFGIGILLAPILGAVTASRKALGAIYGMVQQHAAMLAFVEAFWIMGVLFVFMIPFLPLLQYSKPVRSTETAPRAESRQRMVTLEAEQLAEIWPDERGPLETIPGREEDHLVHH